VRERRGSYQAPFGLFLLFTLPQSANIHVQGDPPPKHAHQPNETPEKDNTQMKKAWLTRRSFVHRAVSAASVAAMGSTPMAWPSKLSRSLPGGLQKFEIPEAAYIRSLGNVPPGPCHPIQDQQCKTGIPTPGYREMGGGLSVPGLGIPLGGIGAGSFMINQCGTFGPWNMGGRQSDQYWEMRTLPQAALHLREEEVGGSGGITIKTLAVPHENIAPERRFGSVLPAWSQLKPGDGSYAALYPFGYITYTGFRSIVSLRFWSPIVAHEDARTSMPVAFFDMLLFNPTEHAMKLSVMMTFPNAPAHSKGSIRTGLYSRYDIDPSSGVGGVTLGSDDPTNTPDSVKSEWTIAAKHAPGQTLTYCTSWNGAGDGSDIYAAFSAAESDGKLPNCGLDQSASAGAVAVTLTLQPKQTSTVLFALSWDFPQIAYGSQSKHEDVSGEAIWMRRYTEFVGAKETEANDYVQGSYPFKQGFAIAREQLKLHDKSLADVEAWWKPIAENANVPAWLRMAALNELYEMVFNGSFWESGLVSNTIPVAPGGPRLGAATRNTHLFYTMDSGGGGAYPNEIDVDSYGYLCYAKLFPALELSRIRALLQMVRQNPIGIGRVPQQIYSKLGPYIGQTDSFQNLPATKPPSQGAPPLAPSAGLGDLFASTAGDPFRDCPHKLIYRTYALYRETGDENLLTYGFAPMLKALEYSQYFRPAGSHLPMDPPSNNPPNTMDQVPVDGHGIYNSQLYLLSLQIISKLIPRAIQLKIPEATPELQGMIDAELVAAKAEFEKLFWNPVTGRYRFCDGTGGIAGRHGTIFGLYKPVLPPDAIHLESFFAQGIAMQLGLPDLIDLQHAGTHLNNVLDKFTRFKDAAGNSVGAPLVLDSNFNNFGLATHSTEISDVLPGVAYMAAASAVRIGKKLGDMSLVAKALKVGEGVAYQTYKNENNGYAFATPEGYVVDAPEVSHFPGYVRARSVWSLVDAVSAISY
jgi:uncharacterized protein (DUF608 family)